MSDASDNAFRHALMVGLLKSWDDKVLKYAEIKGPGTWKEYQAGIEKIMGKRITDSNINSACSRLEAAGKLKITHEVLNPATGYMNSVYQKVD